MDYIYFELDKIIYQYQLQKPVSIFCVKGLEDFTMYMPRLMYRMLRALLKTPIYPETAIKNAIATVLGQKKKGKKMKIHIVIGNFVAKIRIKYPHVHYEISGTFPYSNMLYVPYFRDMLLHKLTKNVAVDYQDFVEFVKLNALPRNMHKAEYELFQLLLDQRSTFIVIEIADKIASTQFLKDWTQKANQHIDNMYVITRYCSHTRGTYAKLV